MKKIFTAILSIVLLATMVSCEDMQFGNDFLEKPVSTDLNLDTVFSNAYYSEQVLAQVYRSMPDFQSQNLRLQWSVLETLTDLAETCKAAINLYQSGNVNATAAENFPFNMNPDTQGSDEPGVCNTIMGLRYANIYIENVDRVPDLTSEQKRVKKAEARMLIAFLYSQVFRYMGGMPWMDHAYSPDDETYMERLTVESMVDSICNICDESAQVLPWRWDVENTGRVSAAFAMAIKFRTLHFAASPLFNSNEPFMQGEACTKLYTWWGNYDENRWQQALDAGLAFLTRNEAEGNLYSLENDKSMLARKRFLKAYSERNNSEMIMEGHRFTVHDKGAKWIAQVRYGNTAPTLTLVDKFQKIDGTEFEWNSADSLNPFFVSMTQAEHKDKNFTPVPNRDPRMYETVWVNGDIGFQGRKAEVWDGGREGRYSTSGSLKRYGFNGVGHRKFVGDPLSTTGETTFHGQFYACPLFRLPEIYLGIAECMNALGRASVADKFGNSAYDYVNMVRERVDMPGIETSSSGNVRGVAQGEELLQYILDERCREFAYEEVRYFDLNRHKLRDVYCGVNNPPASKPLTILFTIKQNDGTFWYYPSTELNYSRLWADQWQASPDNNKYYLTPILESEINKKYGLVQNPGW